MESHLNYGSLLAAASGSFRLFPKSFRMSAKY